MSGAGLVEVPVYKPALSLLGLIFDGNEQQLQLHVTQPGKQAQPLKGGRSRRLACSNLRNSNPKCSYSSSRPHLGGISHPPVGLRGNTYSQTVGKERPTKALDKYSVYISLATPSR